MLRNRIKSVLYIYIVKSPCSGLDDRERGGLKNNDLLVYIKYFLNAKQVEEERAITFARSTRASPGCVGPIYTVYTRGQNALSDTYMYIEIPRQLYD